MPSLVAESSSGSSKRRRDNVLSHPQSNQRIQNQNQHHNRCVLLFDMDCFYAQCERVRLGLPLDVELCLFQWNSVLAVTYPAREHGIKRGDSWDDVAAKTKATARATAMTMTTKTTTTSAATTNGNGNGSESGCYTIHLPIIGHDAKTAGNQDGDNDSRESECDENESGCDDENGGSSSSSSSSIEASYRKIFVLSPEERERCRTTENGLRRFHHQGKACLERYRLASSRIFGVVLESLRERITRRTGHDFVLERASIDEFYLDLTDYCYQREDEGKDEHRRNRTDRHGGAERGIDDDDDDDDENDDFDFDFDFDCNAPKSKGRGNAAAMNGTVVAGLTTNRNSMERTKQQQQRGSNHSGNENDDDENDDDGSIILERALNRACEVSHWIRKDVWKTLGFTMSAGISTNKTMAKLAASYGKPNGQAVLYPRCFPGVLSETRITKVRNFGGKLGKTVLRVLLEYQKQERGDHWNGGTNNETNTTTNNNNKNSDADADADALERLGSTATMADLGAVPLPVLLGSGGLSPESARFVFFASRGIDHEAVKNTSGALVKSITAFKSFSATKSHAEIFDRWLSVLATEIVERVERDRARNRRYPKSCTLNYTYYTTPDGQKPRPASSSSSSSRSSGSRSGSSSTRNININSTRSQRRTRSLRLRFPSEREGTRHQKSASLLAQARARLGPIVRNHPLRGVGLSAGNFAESSSRAATGTIRCFFSQQQTQQTQQTQHRSTATTKQEDQRSSGSPVLVPSVASAGKAVSPPSSSVSAATRTGNDLRGTKAAASEGFAMRETTGAPASMTGTGDNIASSSKRSHSEIGGEPPPLVAASESESNSVSLSLSAFSSRDRLARSGSADEHAHAHAHAAGGGLPSSRAATRIATDRGGDRRASEVATANRGVKTMEDKDLEFARKLQASFDRENYALSTANRRRKNAGSSKKTPRIDAFFRKR